MARKRPAALKEIRVIFLKLDGEEAANIFVSAGEPSEGLLPITLMHDYPDFKPEVGWQIRHDADVYEIKAVEGLNIQAALVPAPEEVAEPSRSRRRHAAEPEQPRE